MNKPEAAIRAEAYSKAVVAMLNSIGNVPFDSKNPHFRNEYASLPSILEYVKPKLAEHGFALTQVVSSGEFGPILETYIMHESGESLYDRYPIQCKDPADPQKFGAAVTYARRYSLCAILGIAGEKDDDGNAGARPGDAAVKATPKQVSELEGLIAQTGTDEAVLLGHYGVDEIEALGKGQAEDAISRLRKKSQTP